jgi:hypothetical protein
MELFGGPVHAICTLSCGATPRTRTSCRRYFCPSVAQRVQPARGHGSAGYVVRTARSCAMTVTGVDAPGCVVPLDGGRKIWILP